MYQKRFIKVLVEKDNPLVDDNAPELTDDQQAMSSTFEKGTQLSDFDANVPDVAPGSEGSISAMSKRMHQELSNWIDQIDSFSKLLNGTDPDSIQTKLNSAEAETLFAKISTAETKKIARTAAELTAMSEMFKGYLAGANSPRYKGV